MAESPRHDHRDSWGGWISRKVATAEAALSTAFASEKPARSHSLHNLRAVPKAARLAEENRPQPDSDHEDQPLPSITRRASAIDVTLSQAWGAMRRAAAAAMSTFDQPAQSNDQLGLHSSILGPDHASQEQSSIRIQSQRDPPVNTPPPISALSGNDSCCSVSSTADSDNLSQHQQPDRENTQISVGKKSWDTQTEISDVTQTTNLVDPDVSLDKDGTFADSPEYPSSTEWEHVRTSTKSSNLDRDHGVLIERDDCMSNIAQDGDDSRGSDSGSELTDETPEKLKEIIDSFNTIFERNGGAECVSRVKEIGDSTLAAMGNPVELVGAVRKELNDAKLKLDNTLERLDSAARIKISETYSEDTEGSAAAEAVIAETRENNICKDLQKRNASLLRDCCRLLAVFATKICAAILESVETDKHTCTWSERVERIASASSRGIPQLRIISKRFADEIVQGYTDVCAQDGRRGFVVQPANIADAAVDHVVQCVAWAVAALQVEVAERASQCCA